MNSIAELLTGGAATLGVMAPYVMYLRRKLRNDTAEADMLAILKAERDEARAAEKVATASAQHAAENAARLQAVNNHQAEEIERLAREFAAFKRLIQRLYPDTREFLDSNFQPPPS